MWFVENDQIFLYKRYCCWVANDTFCFVKPIKAKDPLSVEKTEPLIGFMSYPDKKLQEAGIKAGDLVGFKPNTEYEFVIDGELYYRIFITQLQLNMNIKETKKNIIQAGHKAVEELIKVAKEAIVDSDDDISADRLKNAAATKKLAIFDAFEILNRIQEEESYIKG